MARAIIVGAGIGGLCAARALLKRGWSVEVLERGPVPCPDAASFDRHRLIRAQYTDPGYAARLPAAFAAWEGLWDDLGAVHYVETGVLAVSRSSGDWTDRARASGHGFETLSPDETLRRYPMLLPDGIRFGLLSRRGGVLLSDRILEGLARWLRANGATIRPHTRIDHVDAGAGAVEGPDGRWSGDVVILASGVGLPALAPDLAGDLTPRRVVVVYADPAEAWRDAWAGGPCWADLGGEDDLWGMPPLPGIEMKLGCGRLTRPGDPDTERVVTGADTAAVLEAYRAGFRDADGYRAVRTCVNFYLMAPQERFVLRRAGRVVALSADSGHGFKFGPLIGADVAEALEPGRFDAVARRVAGLPG